MITSSYEFLKANIFSLLRKNICFLTLDMLLSDQEVIKMCEFGNEQNKIRSVTDSLISDNFMYTANMDKVRLHLIRETEKQGLRSSDLAELNKWSLSKTSKITAGRQRLTVEDVRIWSRSLGYTPDPFVNDNVDIRHYKLEEYIRKPSVILKEYIKIANGKPKHVAIANYELPLAILSILGISVSDYIMRTEASCLGIKDIATYSRFWQRTTSSKDSITPEFGFWISPTKDYFLFAVYLNSKNEEFEFSQLRKSYKEILQINGNDTIEFNKIAKENKEWIPKFLRKGEIVSVGSDTKNLLTEYNLEKTIINIFQQYCALTWEVKKIDLLPEKYKQTESFSSLQQFNIFVGNADFSPEVKEEIMQRENYSCENDPTHTTFMTTMGKPYMEVVPIVPFQAGIQFGKNILSADNGICLCPVCKAKMQYGTPNDREDMIFKIFRKHQKSLYDSGIKISLAQVFAANDLS